MCKLFQSASAYGSDQAPVPWEMCHDCCLPYPGLPVYEGSRTPSNGSVLVVHDGPHAMTAVSRTPGYLDMRAPVPRAMDLYWQCMMALMP